MSDNDALVSLAGLSNVASSFDWYLQIQGNDALVDLSGLEGVTAVGLDVTVSDNRSLTNLDALSGIAAVGNGVTIENNASLTTRGAATLRQCTTTVRQPTSEASNPIVGTADKTP